MCAFRKISRHAIRAACAVVLPLYMCGACGGGADRRQADELNDSAFHYRYISADSAAMFADAAFSASAGYEAGRMEALNNMAFAETAKMNYAGARQHLAEVISSSSNRIEIFAANVQMMRLCQRMSENKEFYTYYRAAKQNAERIEESPGNLSRRQRERYLSARSEMKTAYSAYLYYTGQTDAFRRELGTAAGRGETAADTAQLLSYLYNAGSGGFFEGATPTETARQEFSCLLRCYFIALRAGQVYWQANALQAMSEHLSSDEADSLLADRENLLCVNMISGKDNTDGIAEDLALRSLDTFAAYGDTYQTAGALRTLSDCYFRDGAYNDAIAALEESLWRDTLVFQAPALTSGIYERLSINYSALDDKPHSDYYRNLYLDTQEDTRQDRELDVRAEQLGKVSAQLNLILLVLLAAIIALCLTLAILIRKRNSSSIGATVKTLLEPLERWKEQQTVAAGETARQSESIAEQREMAELTLEHNLQINVAQRAKAALVNSIMPFINSMAAETSRLKNSGESGEARRKRCAYIAELNGKINEYNDVLTDWIQLKKGEVSLKIESFPLQGIFDILSKGKAAFSLDSTKLTVKPTTAVVKADRALTLFMLNTIAGNARKAAPGGEVTVSAEETPQYVEIAVADTGKGMSREQLQTLFSRRQTDNARHGFGLMNCKGIIEKYKKVSGIFSVCRITAESTEGNGSVFRFTLPRGIVRTIIAAVCLSCCLSSPARAASPSALQESKNYADSVYFCNLQGRYADALQFAKLACNGINAYYKSVCPDGTDTISFVGTQHDMAELRWGGDSLNAAYGIVLDMRNETAVAALALHEWDIYSYNNKIYTQLFLELSADRDLPGYVEKMQRARDAKNTAVVLLVLLLLCVVAAYYFLYYRHKVLYRVIIDKINKINAALPEDTPDGAKLEKIRAIWGAGIPKARFSAGEQNAFGELENVVRQIAFTLLKSRNDKQKDQADLETAYGELNRIKYESESLHVNNNVLDNCLSALKHETMYYPTAIRQILSSPAIDPARLDEVAQYYKAVFGILSMQAQTRVKNALRPDSRLKAYLLYLLLKLFKGDAPAVTRRDSGDLYEEFIFTYSRTECTGSQAAGLFMPPSATLQCMSIRQIVKEIGESCNKRACGVKAEKRAEGGVCVVLTLAKEINFAETVNKQTFSS